MTRVNTPCIPDRFRYTRNVSETTDAGFSSLNNRSAQPRRAVFLCVSPLRASFYGWAWVGASSDAPVPSVAGLLTPPCARPPHLAVDGGPSIKPKEPAMRASAPARSEQPKPQTPTQRHPLFARAGAAAAELWLSCPTLSLADFRDLRFRTLLSGLTADPDDNARRLAFNAAYAARIASSIAEQSHAGVHHG